MTDKHAPGLLTIQPYVDAIHLLAEDGSVIAKLADRRLDAQGMPPANARHLKASWNACAALTTEALEAGVVGKLVEALKCADEAMCQATFIVKGQKSDLNYAIKQARTAIALVEQTQTK